jgi:hypothetical protein
LDADHPENGVLIPCRNTLYLLGYLSMGAFALALGAIATTRGLGFAVDLGAAAIILMNFSTLVLATTPSTTSPSTAPPSGM